MGDVVSGKYPMSLSSWLWVIERDSLLDFVPIIREQLLLTIAPQPHKIDFGLFIRPFRLDTWKGIIVITCIAIVALLVSRKIVLSCEKETGYQMVIFFSWFFFVLINAYFGGALTMFFASEVSLPFNSLRDVFQSLPEWTLLSLKGNEAEYQLPALQVIFKLQ